MTFEPYPFEKLTNLLSTVIPNTHYEPLSLTIGEPQFETPAFIQERLCQHAALLKKYPKTSGEAALKAAMRGFVHRRFQVMLKHTLWKNQPFPVALGANQQHAPPNAINGHHPALGSQVGKPETLGVVVALEDWEVRRELLLALQRPSGLPPRVLVVHTLPFVQAVHVDDERDDDVSLRGQELLDDVRREEGQVAVYPQHPVLLAQGGLEQSVARLRHVSAAASLVLLAVHDAP